MTKDELLRKVAEKLEDDYFITARFRYGYDYITVLYPIAGIKYNLEIDIHGGETKYGFDEVDLRNVYKAFCRLTEENWLSILKKENRKEKF